MIWLVLGALVPAAIVSVCAAWLVRTGAPRWGLVDQPGHRKVHALPTPLGGGLAIWMGMLLPLAAGQAVLWMLPDANQAGGSRLLANLPEDLARFIEPHMAGLREQSGRLWVLMAAASVLVALGLADDLRGLDWRLRLAVQTAVATFMVWQGWRLTLFVEVESITWLLSICWIVGLINAFNMLDNMDGLSGGVAAIAAAMLCGVLLLGPHPTASGPQLFVAGFLLVFLGAVSGFLWHNRPPARLFMGDAGSYLIGFCLALATIMATFTGGPLPRHAILAPLCVLAVPLYDMATVVVIRLRAGRSPFVGDKSHFSHRLVELGMSKGQAVLTIYLATATCGLGALLLAQVDSRGAAIVALLVACVLTVIGILETTGRRNQRRIRRAGQEGNDNARSSGTS